MKRGESDAVTVRDLRLMLSDSDAGARVEEFLGNDWGLDPRRQVRYTLPQHCTQLDSETHYEWADE